MIELRKGKNIDESKLVGVFENQDAYLTQIYQSEQFEPPYFRMWGTDELMKVDYGKYDMFYFMLDLSEKLKGE
ncbi:hypothetical protein KQI68_07110 [Peptoniphilus sp. MSJ-1]|uniref:Uncharacterized protein n=1 Tax=Peptoniphilus ovalis TaxID=2841503 RepID=A0ABS6FHF6_9FIRM|nr:hypothetical protein [Peptoniphilus ovalis]MBU5669607.1 hypothetical protein [Peptoniphilus ovalis]